uniref:Ferric reductase domain protein transmembrane component domain protein n=1 Tax=Cyanothece sp. (strain PCC 7425 / ATCC 29141) TaxID=395961 RepID=B8HLT3_CYAP4
MSELLLITLLGFLGSFGHCVGMCGPIAVAFSLTHSADCNSSWKQQLFFNGLLHTGRLLSYTLVGAAIGTISSVLVGGGQLAGIGSLLRQSLSVITGLMLVWFGLAQVHPQWLPRLPLLNPLATHRLSRWLQSAMAQVALGANWWSPIALGGLWGLMPCGFLYAAQIKAAETGDPVGGAITMLGFGVGTLPVMLGVGLSTSFLSAGRRGQLFRAGGWITLCIGLLTLFRTGDLMVNYSGYAALLCLVLALVARPLSRLYPYLLPYRRVLGVGTFVLSLAHVLHTLTHNWNWQWQAIAFLLPWQQFGIGSGTLALLLLTPPTLTSFDQAQQYLGKFWRKIHLLSLPALLLGSLHCILNSSQYLGTLHWSQSNQIRVILLALLVAGVLLLRSRWFWKHTGLERWYVPPLSPR